MPRVALFSANFLTASQTFVHEPLRFHTRYEVEVFTKQRSNAARFPFEPVHVGGPLYAATRWSPRFARLFRTRRYDLIHAHFGTHATYAMPYAQRFGLPLIVNFHGYDVALLESARRWLPKHWGYALLGPRLLRQMSLGLCVSRDMLEVLLDLDVPPEKLVHHPLGIDTRLFCRGPRDEATPQVILIGRFVAKKGMQYGLRAFARVLQAGQRAHLTLVGDGPLRPRLEALAARLGVASSVTFAGMLPYEEVARHLSRSDVLLAPSVVTADGDREGIPMVIKEACASEVVPIGTYHGGIPESIEDGRTGFLVPERDVEALADRLGRLLADPSLRQALGYAARLKMEREFDNRACVARLEQHYDAVLERFARPRP